MIKGVKLLWNVKSELLVLYANLNYSFLPKEARGTVSYSFFSGSFHLFHFSPKYFHSFPWKGKHN